MPAWQPHPLELAMQGEQLHFCLSLQASTHPFCELTSLQQSTMKCTAVPLRQMPTPPNSDSMTSTKASAQYQPPTLLMLNIGPSRHQEITHVTSAVH